MAVAFLCQWRMNRRSLDNVEYDAWPSVNMTEPGASFFIVTELRNEKWLPEFYLEVIAKLPVSTNKEFIHYGT
jgi:hypothetical protein